jgi:hypothetical protein
VISCLQEIDAVLANSVYEAVFLGNSAGPATREHIFKWLRLPDAGERIAQNRFNQVKGAQRDFAIRINPISQVFTKFWMENRISLSGPH